MYAFTAAGRVIYIGSAVNLRDRMTDHGLRTRGFRRRRRSPFPPDSQLRISTGGRPGSWLAREYRLIQRLRPPLNRTHTTPGRRRRGRHTAAATLPA